MQEFEDEVEVDLSEIDSRCRFGLYLGGLPLNCQERDIREYFSRFGKVHDACVKRNPDGSPKGCGSVQFEIGEEIDCKAVLESSHRILNKVIEVKKFVDCPIKQKQLLKEDIERSIFIKKLSPECKDEDLQRHFQKFGKIERGYIICKDGKSRCFGIVKFFCLTSVEAALNTKKHVIKGKEAIVQRKCTKIEQQQMKDPSKSCKSGATSVSDGLGKEGQKKELVGSLGHQSYGNQAIGPAPIVINGIVYAPVCPATQKTQQADIKPLIPSNIGMNPNYQSYLPHIPPYYPPSYSNVPIQPCHPGYPQYYPPCTNFVNSMPFIENYNLQTCYYQKSMDKAKMQADPNNSNSPSAGKDDSIDGCSSKRVGWEEHRKPKDSGCQSLFPKKKEDDYCTNFSKNMVDYLYEEKPSRGPCNATSQPQISHKPPEKPPQKPPEKPAEPKQPSGFFKFFNPCSKSKNALSQSKVCPFSKCHNPSKKDREDPSDKKN